MEDRQPTIGEQLAAMNVKLDILIQQRDDHEARIRSLEQFKWILLGVAVASGGIWQALAARLVH